MGKAKTVVPIKKEEFGEKGESVYGRLKDSLEPQYNGKIVAVEVDSGNYFLGGSVADALLKAKSKYPDKIFYVVRVGHRAVYRVPRV